jgi:hypothetical protein
MKALTVRQPWAYAIAALGKTIENRTWAHPYYRGLLAIHAGARWDGNDAAKRVFELSGRYVLNDYMSAIIAVVELVDICRALDGCECGPWAVAGQFHWRLADRRQLPEPVPCKGRLGLWDLTAEVKAAVMAQLAVPAVERNS